MYAPNYKSIGSKGVTLAGFGAKPQNGVPMIKKLLAALLLCLSFCGCAAPEPVSETRLLLDTVCTVTLYAPADQALAAQALDLCAKYEALFSRTMEGSDIWRINHADGAPVQIAPSTAELLTLAISCGEFSGGLFDITVGRLCALWDFGGVPMVPEQKSLAGAQATVGYQQLRVDGNTAQLVNPQAWLDLGGIAKGYIADKLAVFLREAGVKAAVIDLGGNIVTVGQKPGGKPWNIGVEQPFSGHSALIGSLSLGEAAIVTSGIYERQFEQNGQLYHHILDPATGWPATSDVVSVTVVSENAAWGDALSTIIIVAGSEKSLQLLEQAPDVRSALLQLKNGELIQYGGLDFTAIGP